MDVPPVGRDRLTRQEAEERSSRVDRVAYDLALELEAGAKSYRGEAEISFSLQGEGDTFLDFSGGTVEWMELNGEETQPDWGGHRIRLAAESLADENRVRVAYRNHYDHGGEGFHQFVDPEDGAEYLYTQFEPYQAHRLLPCFDQPDLKGNFRLVVDALREWEIVTNTPLEGEDLLGEGRSRRSFARSLPFSTYLLAVVAGPYAAVRDRHGDVPLGLFCRESLLDHLEAEELLEVTKQGIDFFQDFFSHPYPFTKYDQVFVPEFNWGGMENVGAVTYTDTYLFRDPPIAVDRLRRAEVFLHELAHMWFGNLVTMRWWDDLWLNESFATYMAYLALERATRFSGGWQDFHTRMKVWAYRQDELVTTHQIADQIPSTEEVFLNFDGITYGKGASVIKQLVATIGLERFRDGMRRYFERHAYGNATLSDFLSALQRGSGMDLETWAKTWLQTRSPNTLEARWDEVNGALTQLRIVQSAPPDHPHLRPHVAEVALVTGDGLETVPLRITEEEAELKVGHRAAPRLVFPNHGDHAYAKVLLDPRSAAALPQLLGEIDDPLLRQLLWTSAWTMVRDRRLPSTRFLEMVRDRLPREDDLGVVGMVTGLTAGSLASRSPAPPVLDFYLPEDLRPGEAQGFASAAWSSMDGEDSDLAKTWARSLLCQVEAPDDLARAGSLVEGEERFPPDLVDQDMRWEVATRWVAHGVEGGEARLASEQERDPTDRGVRALARAEAARPDPAVKALVWDRIHARDYPSLHLARSAMSGFNWPHQRELLQPYVDRFFHGLPEVFATWEREAAKQYFTRMFPWYRIDRDLVERTRYLLSEVGEEEAMLQRMLREAIDEAERAVACREHASG